MPTRIRPALVALAFAVATFAGTASTALMATTNVFAVSNFPLPAAPPGYFVPNVNGAPVPAGHSAWALVFDTTGLPTGQPLADVVVQYHYTSVQLGAAGQPDQGFVTNADGSQTSIVGGTFTGWIDDCEAPLPTSFVKFGQTIMQSFLGCDLNRIMGAYPDRGRFLVKSSPGYASVTGATLILN